ncbi:EAL domain-containing protein [Lacticaseibacillus absianus]|uniref:EAL domain-containing protein n=1 Tax=Lacticaseibacillus absianus TaxID=2729623 RepID=UPI0015C6AA8C|nr:EAL domain-containing protein [Lacticaseibacillus absianus]
MATMTFFGQAVFNVAATRPALVGYELLARTKYHNQWIVPENVGETAPDQLEALIPRALRALPPTLQGVSFNLSPRQFVRPAFWATVARLRAQSQVPLTVELTEARDPFVPTRALIEAAKQYAALKIPLWIDDVGCGQNLPGVVEGLTPYALGYKFARQDLRDLISPADLADRQAFWAAKAQAAGRAFVIEGVETEAEFTAVSAQYPTALMQGCYLAAPARLQAGRVARVVAP